MKSPNIPESEWVLMETLWKRSPQTASEVARGVQKKTGWALATVRTLLKRLVEKGALRSKDNQSGVRVFEPSVQRDACLRAESKFFLQRVFQGDAKALLNHFAATAKLTAEDVREVKRTLEQAGKK